MTPARTLLRGAAALLGDDLSFDGQPCDVLVEHAAHSGRHARGTPAMKLLLINPNTTQAVSRGEVRGVSPELTALFAGRT